MNFGRGPTAAMLTGTLLLAVLVTLVHPTTAYNYSLAIKKDNRRVIDLGVFGFGGSGGGKFVFRLNYFLLDEVEEYMSTDENIGFTLDMVQSAAYARQERNYAIKETKGEVTEERENVCFIQDPVVSTPNRYLIALQDHLARINKEFEETDGKQKHLPENERVSREEYFRRMLGGLQTTITVPPNQAGLYALFFYNCKKANRNVDPVHTSFAVDVSQFNIQEDGTPNYLSIGDTHLPAMYFIFFLLFSAGLVAWHRVLFHSPPQVRLNVRSIHFLMYALLVLKCASLLLNAAMLHFRKQTGKLNGGWDHAFYVFQTLRGIALFTVIILLGTGWSFLKPFLSERDRNLLFLLLPLQAVVNIAIAVLDETSEGSKSWARWRDVLHIFDVVCCCAVLLPVIWSMKNLKDAAGADGKARQNFKRLKQFRTFYVAVVIFIYFTRIVISFIDNSVSFQHTWLPNFLYEGAALMFYCFTGLRFRPKANPMRIGDEGDGSDPEDELEAAAMKGGDVEELDLDDREEDIPEPPQASKQRGGKSAVRATAGSKVPAGASAAGAVVEVKPKPATETAAAGPTARGGAESDATSKQGDGVQGCNLM